MLTQGDVPVGAIGVSGATADEDEQIGKAGAAALHALGVLRGVVQQFEGGEDSEGVGVLEVFFVAFQSDRHAFD